MIAAWLFSIASVKHDTLIQPTLVLRQKRRVNAIGPTMSFFSAGKAGYCAALRLVSSGKAAVVAAAGEQTKDRTVDPYKLGHSLQDETDSVAAVAEEGIAVRG